MPPGRMATHPSVRSAIRTENPAVKRGRMASGPTARVLANRAAIAPETAIKAAVSKAAGAAVWKPGANPLARPQNSDFTF